MAKSIQIKSADEILKEETGDIRTLNKYEKKLITIIAVTWALFQLSLASWLILDSIKVRAIHLSFAMSMLFLTVPLSRKEGRFKFFSKKDGIHFTDYGAAIIGVILALYIMFDWEGLAVRMGALNGRDLFMGSFLVLFLLEATRRIIGPALPVIALLFTTWAFFAPHMPYFLSSKAVTMGKYINQVSLSSEGIYGIPLGVSATIVYLFVLLGSMLDKAGAGQFFTTLAISLLGRFKGGPAKAAVISSGLTGLISGSSIANIVTTGTFTIPLMKKVGYPAKKAAAIEVAASTDGQLMPPIMGAAAFIIAEYVNVPYIEVVKAAAIPAFVSYIALFYVTHLEASKLNMKGLRPEDIPSFRKTLKNGFHYIVPIAVLIYELVVLRHSPELAAFRAVIILALIILYQEIKKSINDRETIKSAFKRSFSLITEGFVSGSKNMVVVALATASAGIIVGIVGMGFGGLITQAVEIIARGNVFLLLFITAAASLLLGMGLPTTATYIVMASLTAPIIVNVGGIYGITIPLIASHLFCFYFGILADDTPPVGLAAYASAAIAKANPIATGIQGFLYDLRTAVIPFFFVLNPDLILHNIHSWAQGFLIFAMAVLGAFAFTSAIQGWFIIKNVWAEVPFLLFASLILYHPGSISNYVNVSNNYYIYLIGILILALIYLEQRWRRKTN